MDGRKDGSIQDWCFLVEVVEVQWLRNGQILLELLTLLREEMKKRKKKEKKKEKLGIAAAVGQSKSRIRQGSRV